MGEWAVIAQVAQYLFMVLVTIVAFFIKRAMSRQDEFNEKLATKIDDILIQVHATNGKVIVLEEWKRNHTKEVDSVHLGLRESMANLWSRLNSFIDGHNGR
ncbi:MAG: hypothetical protein R3B95_11600 [Nitrospirales bacterium]|nr:hypothetical protein [Nitrospirales bacterium]